MSCHIFAVFFPLQFNTTLFQASFVQIIYQPNFLFFPDIWKQLIVLILFLHIRMNRLRYVIKIIWQPKLGKTHGGWSLHEEFLIIKHFHDHYRNVLRISKTIQRHIDVINLNSLTRPITDVVGRIHGLMSQEFMVTGQRDGKFPRILTPSRNGLSKDLNKVE